MAAVNGGMDRGVTDGGGEKSEYLNYSSQLESPNVPRQSRKLIPAQSRILKTTFDDYFSKEKEQSCMHWLRLSCGRSGYRGMHLKSTTMKPPILNGCSLEDILS